MKASVAPRALARARASGSTARLAAAAKLALVTGLAMPAGCAGEPPPRAAPAAAAPRDGDEGGARTLSVSAEIGALDEGKVKQAFERAAGKLTACFAKGAERLPYLSGDVRFVLRIASGGTAKGAYVKDSTLGDRETEECMLRVLKGATWPSPVGGNEGLAENQFSFDPNNEERPPVAWQPEQLGAPYRKAKAALSRCRKGAGAVKATLYVDTDGKPASIGVSTADERAAEAVPCVVQTLRGLTFPSPGSYASKVSVVLD